MKYFLCLFSILSSVLFLQCGRFYLVENNSSHRKDSNFSKKVATDTPSMTDDAGPMPNVPGECYAKSIVHEYEEKETIVPIAYDYNDEPLGEKHYEEIKIMTAAASKKWIKRKADKNCTSSDPEDCMVWCLVELPERYETIKRYKKDEDTDYYIRDSIMRIKYSTEVNIEWRSVVCDDGLTQDLIQDVQFALDESGYLEEPYDDSYSNKVREALIEYQKDNYLPIGQLDMETLEALGVEY